MIPVEIPQRRGEPIIFKEDEEYKNVKLEKVAQLRPAFSKEGTVTAANASTLNDGAAALVIMSREKADELGLNPWLLSMVMPMLPRSRNGLQQLRPKPYQKHWPKPRLVLKTLIFTN